ncbi:MAG: prepilin-type N-terminal cleavage/methylation domain-containing protein [Pirellulales bacterium]
MISANASRRRRAGFTLFELILAVALSAILLSIIGLAINLYLMRVDSDRGRVEEAQLARSVLNMITDDIRGATIYKPQDTSAIAQLMAASKPFDVDSLDKARETLSKGGGMGGPGGTGSVNKIAAMASGASAASGKASGASASASSSNSSSGSKSSSSSSTSGENDETMPLGLTGSDLELYVDVAKLPYQDELFGTVTGYTNAPSAAAANPGGTGASTSTGEVHPPADVKTVHYYVRSGGTTNSSDTTSNELSPTVQSGASGLVRQEIGRSERLFAEQSGGSDVLNSGGVLVAPEVVQLQFRYYDGSQLLDTWDMKELQKLPTAIEVTVWLRPANLSTESSDDGAAQALTSNIVQQSHSYRQVVYLPMAAQSQASAGGTAAAGSSTTSSSSTGSTDGSSTDGSSTGGSSSGGSVFQ